MSRVVNWSSLRRLDIGLLAATIALMAVGILFVFSAGYRGEGLPTSDLCARQIGWMAVGILCMMAVAALNYHLWLEFAWWGYFLGLLLLVLTLRPGIGVAMYGARRWLDLGFVNIQPAEFVKIIVVVALARLLGQPGRNLKNTRYTALVLLLIAAPIVLIVRQPDLGTALVLPPTALAMMYVAGVPGRHLKWIIAAGILTTALVLGAVTLPAKLGATIEQQDRIVRMAGLSPYHRDRILVFLDSERDPLNAGWNKAQSGIAVGSGGMWGKGYLNGTQNLLGFLPRTVAPTDFIFSVIAEEMGFMGSVGLLALFAMVIISGARAALAANDVFGRLTAIGLVSLCFCHVFINIAMTIGLMPITGIPLPFMSYGSSFMMVNFALLGLIGSVYAHKG